MVQQRQLAELLHGKLSSRSRLIAVTLTPFSVFYLMVRLRSGLSVNFYVRATNHSCLVPVPLDGIDSSSRS